MSEHKIVPSDSQHEFEKAVSDAGWASNYQGDGQYGGVTIPFAWKMWQACQRLNDARINTLNAAITEDNISSAHTKALQSENERLRAQVEALLAVNQIMRDALNDAVMAKVLSGSLDHIMATIEAALALNPSDVELVEVGTVASQSTYLDEVLFSPDKNTSRVEVGAKLYALKQKEGK